MRRPVACLVLALLVAGDAFAARPPRIGARTAAEASSETTTPESGARDESGEAPVVPNEDVPAQEATGEIWEWVARLEGEIPTEAAIVAIREQSEEQLAELALIDQLGKVDVPTDFYADPAKVLKVDPLHLDKVDPSEFDIPIVVNDEVVKWMRYFTGPGRKYYARWLARSTRYRPMMYEMLEARGMPRDLVYLSMIESGYNAHAYSHADAAGLWQFIPSTGRLYHLRVDWWMDERRDPELSTAASLTFLSDLHRMFGKWELAWAAYNTGPGRVKRASSRAGSTDYWDLVRGDYLHPETENYVPKIMAAAIIGKHPERYGFTGIEYQDELVYDKVKVDGSVDLEVLARCAGTSLEEFQFLNPALRRWATPPEGAEVRVPKGKSQAFVAALDKVPHNERLAITEHKVARGETLGTIARRYGTSSSAIAKANRLKDADVIRVGQVLVVPTRDDVPETARTAPAPTPSKAAPAPAPPKAAVHTVASGETLSTIASRYGVAVSALKSSNGLRGDTIYVGQKLTVSGGTSTAANAPAPSATKTTYTVQRGDTLSGIASKHGASLADVQRWNQISNPSSIQAGQKLVLYVKASEWAHYTVKGGDSLGAIAARHGCTVAELQSWNALPGTVIHPGQVLKVRRA